MKNEFAYLLDELEKGREAFLRRTVDGAEYTRVFSEPERLILLGAGHVSQAVAQIAAKLDFAVTVVDDRQEFANVERFPEAAHIVVDDFVNAVKKLCIRPLDYVCILTRGHRSDGACLRAILSCEDMPYYLGMIGSRRRTSVQLQMLRDDGFDPERVGAVHTPIGLAIKAVTPMEIAVSITAEMILMRRSKPSDPSRLERTDAEKEVLRFAADQDSPKALMMVIERSGSAPTRSGSLMVLDGDGRSVGTVGGGLCEAEAMRAAAELIKTGGSKVLTVDMSNEVAAEEGMACGGNVKILVESIPL